VYGPDHYEIAVNLNNLAAIRQDRGEVDEAERLFRRALEIKERLIGAASPDTAVTAFNLAMLLRSSGREEEAGGLLAQALAAFESALGSSHPHTRACRKAMSVNS